MEISGGIPEDILIRQEYKLPEVSGDSSSWKRRILDKVNRSRGFLHLAQSGEEVFVAELFFPSGGLDGLMPGSIHPVVKKEREAL